MTGGVITSPVCFGGQGVDDYPLNALSTFLVNRVAIKRRLIRLVDKSTKKEANELTGNH